ncbi:LuxR C-terminal-related transcriptional regulator [Sphingomonas desiccabilis]|uniref:LuxR C-terminal-related transcriptional regulator n=1 Tax=Sphingomonas desiccabilis TaxID=429134 RepID=UPI0013EDE54B|nr:helix-turn-helix transcriptional regulator [Sphingomonas desiccabilis]MBB3911827.1 DNA-binding CsgD family transcriptional regulator [Sphingomonas desiccabilis]
MIRVMIGATGVCLDILMTDHAPADPSTACVVVVGKELSELRVAVGTPPDAQDPSGPTAEDRDELEGFGSRNEFGQAVRVAIQGAAGIPLSPREMEVLHHIAAGRSNKVIAQAMNISGETVRAHVKSIFRKAGLENRTQAALWAVTVTSSDFF